MKPNLSINCLKKKAMSLENINIIENVAQLMPIKQNITLHSSTKTITSCTLSVHDAKTSGEISFKYDNLKVSNVSELCFNSF